MGTRLLGWTAAGIALSLMLAAGLYGLPFRWVYVLSWNLTDKPYMPKGQQAHPLLGPHYFGDWQLYVAWAKDPHPYFGHVQNSNMLPPATWLIAVIGLLPFGPGYLVWLAVSVGLSVTAVWLLTAGAPTWARVVAWPVLVAGSTGLVVPSTEATCRCLSLPCSASGSGPSDRKGRSPLPLCWPWPYVSSPT